MSAVIKVLVDVRDREVHVQELAETVDGLALNPRSPFSSLGTVRQVTIEGKRGVLKVWRWESDGYKGDAPTKAKALDDMLKGAGYEAVSLTATIPDMLKGLL